VPAAAAALHVLRRPEEGDERLGRAQHGVAGGGVAPDAQVRPAFVFTWGEVGGCSGDFTATWRLSDGELHFTDIRTAERLDEVYWGVRPFRKIG
jgi:hypothetical protein